MLVHEAEEYVEVDLVVFATCHDLVDDRLKIFECLDVGNIRVHQRLAIQFPGVLLDILGHVKQALQVAQRVIGFSLVDLTVELTLAGTIHTSLID